MLARGPVGLCVVVCVLAWAVALVGVVSCAQAQAMDASLAAGRPLAPMEVRWKPILTSSPLPPWAPGPVEATPVSALIPIPTRWRQPEIDRYVLTVVFYDTEDSGPVVEWRSPDGVLTRLSEGLGEGESALGLHVRIMILPDAITKDGGAVIVSMPWRQDGLVSATVQPARDLTVAVAGASSQPGLVQRSGNVVESELLEGRDVPPVSGDVREGPIVEAELTAPIEALDSELEFSVPIDGRVEGGIVHAEIIGLEPDSRVEVEINGRRMGEMNPAAFRLDDPAVTIESDGRLTMAGWRKHSLFLPSRSWKQGDNSLVFRLRRPLGPSATQVSMKNTFLHLRFANNEARVDVIPSSPFLSQLPARAAVPLERWPTVTSEPPEPDFETPLPLVDEPPVLPTVVTVPPPAVDFAYPSVTLKPEPR